MGFMDYLEIISIQKSVENKNNVMNAQIIFGNTPLLDAVKCLCHENTQILSRL